MLSLTQSTGADRLTLPLPSTDGADAGDRSSNGLPIPVRCIHRIKEPKIDFLLIRTEPI